MTESRAIAPAQRNPATMLDMATAELIDVEAFQRRKPFPWASLQGWLTSAAFAALKRDFPPRDRFERHHDMPKLHGQRPHNRYYLAFERSIYHSPAMRPPSEGVIGASELTATWQRFIAELDSARYRALMGRLIGRSDFDIRFAWHIGTTGSEVSPHVDSARKIATHIFYFNTSDDWSPEWGGSTLVFGDKRTSAMNPEFEDFGTVAPVATLDNRSFLFRNSPEAWHGVRPLTCPSGSGRLLFNVIMELPDRTSSSLARRISSWAQNRLRGQ